jgi:hypothetical protein
MSSGLPVASALTSLNDRAVSPMSEISRVSSRPCMTWLMNRALRSRVCHMYPSKDRSVTYRMI